MTKKNELLISKEFVIHFRPHFQEIKMLENACVQGLIFLFDLILDPKNNLNCT